MGPRVGGDLGLWFGALGGALFALSAFTIAARIGLEWWRERQDFTLWARELTEVTR